MLLKPDIQRQLDAAVAWLELRNWREANEELEQLRPEFRSMPQVLVLRCKIYAAAEQWEDVCIIAEGAGQAYPRVLHFPVHLALAKHRLGQTAEALESARTAWRQRKAKNPELAYTIACLQAALGRYGQAKRWLGTAFEEDHSNRLKLRALDEPELAPIWKMKEMQTFRNISEG